MLVSPRKFHFSQKSTLTFKVKAAEFLTKKFGVLHDNPGQGGLLSRVCGQNYETTKWQLPNPQGVESIEGLGNMLARALLDKKGWLKIK